jgi:predicted anti-sigma-YlaC factor YlaD
MAIRTNYSDFVQGTAVRKEAPVQRPYVRPEEHKVQVKRQARRRVSLPVAASAMLALFSFSICAYMMLSYVMLRS